MVPRRASPLQHPSTQAHSYSRGRASRSEQAEGTSDLLATALGDGDRRLLRFCLRALGWATATGGGCTVQAPAGRGPPRRQRTGRRRPPAGALDGWSLDLDLADVDGLGWGRLGVWREGPGGSRDGRERRIGEGGFCKKRQWAGLFVHRGSST